VNKQFFLLKLKNLLESGGQDFFFAIRLLTQIIDQLEKFLNNSNSNILAGD